MRAFRGTLVCAVVLASSSLLAAPGDPFGDDDPGCAPTTKLGLSCAKNVGTLVEKLRQAIVKCHRTQAEHAFKAGHSSPGFDTAEENCEIGPSARSAKAKFDDKLAEYADAGCDPTVIANAQAARGALLADQFNGGVDVFNGVFFCDSTSGLPIADPSGSDQDEPGWIPADAGNYKCAFGAYKYWVKLHDALLRIHVKLATAVYWDRVYVEELEEIRALQKYWSCVDRFVAAGICSPCLTSAIHGLGELAVIQGDSELGNLYICPGP
jgi:hypothetical protein